MSLIYGLIPHAIAVSGEKCPTNSVGLQSDRNNRMGRAKGKRDLKVAS
ncbi:predicted protein [Plenodomus lingam JN3]|uniref:Predicted protein n=1 Tax=Leptosphaeria maculans (strain JN3 / isolate v23.1.3 / race Av1-4-5-6-7-8) TaxID=985895 RepID=E4ZR35_LEPMJ|nr:predicted protein [Plenodomus lingam JN3]CBX93700.1 predicted protein [Plenodomus lingam JN3]